MGTANTIYNEGDLIRCSRENEEIILSLITYLTSPFLWPIYRVDDHLNLPCRYKLRHLNPSLPCSALPYPTSPRSSLYGPYSALTLLQPLPSFRDHHSFPPPPSTNPPTPPHYPPHSSRPPPPIQILHPITRPPPRSRKSLFPSTRNSTAQECRPPPPHLHPPAPMRTRRT